ncbi:VWA domain-containing protein [Nocardioides sp. CER19]|uniref:VWA domain-containing protein n=1 Tax=Nocardioides sp. CER19 TaxID=3038538 RepID=UPI0024497628|nr:VWA domain-containing protein [Nocardioides sp. CER19]MDH2416033.1 VWA domain-containing protein [Nocardioides sp. CER19]
MPLHYPFSAVLGCEPEALDDMGLALVLTTIAPEIGGVLIRGEKGTAKSTTVRALAGVLPPIEVYAADRFSIDPADPSASSPDGPFAGDAEVHARPVRLVELPVGATEDRVLGSLHLERALSQGTVEYEPGLLARAHRGVLYVDEVNLLHDHLVDLLLDAAAMGRVSVERDGVSVEHAARFVLIGTMNPEEGELRPQLLDRFGLTVEVAAPRDPASRVEVVRRRMAFDADPAAFVARHRASDALLTARIEDARSRVGKVRLGDAALLKIAEICAALEVDGLRADIVTARAAVAHAAWCGRDEVTRADIRRAALLALPHRRRRNPFDAPGIDEELLDRLLGEDELPPEPPEGPGDTGDAGGPGDPEGSGSGESSTDRGPEPVDGSPLDGPAPGSGEQSTDPAQEAVDDSPLDGPAPGSGEQSTDPGQDTVDGSPPGATAPGRATTVGATAPYRPRLLKVDGLGDGESGRRSRAIASTGRRVGARRPDGPTGSLHLVETLLAAAGKQGARGRAPGGRVELRGEDLRVAVREGREANLVLFCVDASGSMAARKRMAQVKTAILSLLLDAYRRRDKVGLITFRGQGAELVLPPTRSVDIAAARLDEVPAGGRTPLAEGLLEAATVLTRERLRDPRLRPLLVVVTDGRATGGKDAVARSLLAADHVAGLGITTVVVDSESGPLRLRLALRLAERLGAEHLPVADVSAEALTSTVRTRGAA